MTPAERFVKFRTELLAAGGLDVRAYLPPDAAEALMRLTADGTSKSEAIARAVILAAGYTPKDTPTEEPA